MRPVSFVAKRASQALPELGVGITYSSAIEPLLERDANLVDVVEFEPQTTWVETRDREHPYRVSDTVLDHIVQLPGRKLVHSIGAPVGGSVRPQAAQLALLRRIIAKLNAPWTSEHLSFNQTEEFSTGFFLPPCQTSIGVETVTTSIADLQEALPVPIAIETGVNYLRPRPDEIPDGAFVREVAECSDCGILLDLHNVFANAANGRQPVEDFLHQLPLDRVWEVHLAGGFEMDGFWLDAHSGAIPDPLLEIARWVVPALPNLKAIIFEIFPSFVPGFGLNRILAEIEKLHELWDLRGKAAGDRLCLERQQHLNVIADNNTLPATWENALGSLVIGRPPADIASQQLAADPGVAIVNRLAREFRASMIVSVLRLTSRLVMLALGPDIFRSILEDFWSKTPPQQFAASEAETFATYLEALGVSVPQLTEVLKFERAALATLMDNQPRIIAFEFDPLPLLRSLAEGRLPKEMGRLGRFEIEITGGGLLNAPGLGMQPTQQVVPYH
jgi:uncharacterized protein